MTARKKSTKDFWDKPLSANKVKRVLDERFEIDTDSFKEAYEEDTARGIRGARKPSDEEIAAVKQWRKDKDMDALMEAIGTENIATANACIRRVFEHEE